MTYKIWDKKEPLYTPAPDQNGKQKWEAQEYIDKHAQWAEIPGVDVVIYDCPLNCGMFTEYTIFIQHYVSMGLEITPEMSRRDVLDAIEAFEADAPTNAAERMAPEPIERIAAALEFLGLMEM